MEFDDLPSKGSQLHATRTCRPCHYEFSKAGCWKGGDCDFCHIRHPKSRTHLSKKKRFICRLLVFELHSMKVSASLGQSVRAEVIIQAETNLQDFNETDARLAQYASTVLHNLRARRGAVHIFARYS